MILILNNRKGSVGKNLWYIIGSQMRTPFTSVVLICENFWLKVKTYFMHMRIETLIWCKKRNCHIFIYFKSILREKNPQYTVCPYTWSWWRRYTCKCLMWKTLHLSLSWCFEACVLSVWFSLSLQTEGVWWHPIG